MRSLYGFFAGLALMVSVFLLTPTAQGQFWVLVNGALNYTGPITVTGTTTTGGISLNGALLASTTAPTVTSAGTSPSVSGTNTASFRVNVGTGGTATTITMAMPAAATGWNCSTNNITGAAANRAAGVMVEQSSTTTSVVVQYQTVATGIALAFTASDIVSFVCAAF